MGTAGQNAAAVGEGCQTARKAAVAFTAGASRMVGPENAGQPECMLGRDERSIRLFRSDDLVPLDIALL
jgi:hypothetical protein